MNDYLFRYRYKKESALTENENKQKEDKKAYGFYIANFSRPILHYNRIGKDIENLIEYDLVDEISTENEINGHSEKRFARVHSNYFFDYFDAVAMQYSNCSYVSYLSNSDIISNNIPTNLSVLIKKIYNKKPKFSENAIDDMAIYAEYVCPKIMNYFGIKTAFNNIVKKDLYSYVLSLDFIKPGEYYYCSKELDSSLTLSPSDKLDESLEAIRCKCDILTKRIVREYNVAKPTFDLSQIQRDFIGTYLVRVLLLGDIDFGQKNFGFIYNADKGTIETSAGFDYELCFCGIAKTIYNVKRQLEFIYNNYYEVFRSFVDKLKIFVGENVKNRLEQSPALELFENEVDDEAVAEYFYDRLKSNARFLIDKYQEFENAKMQGQSK